MTVEEQLEAMAAQITALTEALNSQKSEGTPPDNPPPVEPSPPSQDEIIAKLHAEEEAKNAVKSSIADQAQALKFLQDELPTMTLDPKTQAVIDAYAGDRDNYVAHRDWTMRAYLKNEALGRITEEQIASMPAIYRQAISTAKSGADFDIASVYSMVRELEITAAKQAEERAKLDSLHTASRISDDELAKLSPEKQVEYRALQRYQQASDARWERFAAAKK